MTKFFICEDVLLFVEKQREEIQKSFNQISPKTTKPIFIYTYAIFESTITEILRYFLFAFPGKIDKNLMIDKNTLLNTTMADDLLLEFINVYIRKYSSKKLIEYIRFFNEQLNIDVKINKKDVEIISEKRNKIVHDNSERELLIMHINNYLHYEITVEEVKKYSSTMLDILKEVAEQIGSKYNNYTRELLVRSIWEDTFETPLLRFEDIWEFDKEGFLKIKNLSKLKEQAQNICRSEHLLLSVFLHQCNNSLNGKIHTFEDIPMLVSVDSKTKDKLIKIIRFFSMYPHFFCGDVIV